MGHISVKDLCLAFADRDILKSVNFTLDQKHKAALAGVNGSGKTSFMKILAGMIPPDSGQVLMTKGLRVSYLPQSGVLLGRGSVQEEAEAAFDYLTPLLDEWEELGQSLARDPEGPGLQQRLERHHEIAEQLEESGYHRRRAEAQQVLLGLGFSTSDLDRPAGEFSGGWQMRIALARTLLARAHFLFLDEPTNYLDLEAKDWLEQYLKSFPGGILMVSHDRSFLDALVDQVFELFLGNLTVYRGNYSTYEVRRAQELESLQAAFVIQQEEIRKTEEFISRFRYNSSKATQVQSRIKQLEKTERIVIPENFQKVKIRFPAPPHSGRQVLALRNVGRAYGTLQVFSGLDLDLEKGQRLVITGRNGSGKSTLMRILSGQDQEYQGSVTWGSGVRIGYFSQDHESRMDPTLGVLEALEAEAPTEVIPRLRDLLGAFLFRGDDVYKKQGMLSGGEKGRVSLLKLLLEPINLLILDEPTNHLDLHSKDVLLEALQQYQGTLVFVSHDRYFIEHLADSVLEMSGGQGHYHPGDYNYYLHRRQNSLAQNGEDSNQRDSQTSTFAGPMDGQGNSPGNGNSSSQQSRLEQKKAQAAMKRLEREEASLLGKMEDSEAEKAQLEREMGLPENYSQGDRVKDLQERLKKNLEEHARLMEAWENVALELEEWRSQGQD